jgi:hypothetical protein
MIELPITQPGSFYRRVGEPRTVATGWRRRSDCRKKVVRLVTVVPVQCVCGHEQFVPVHNWLRKPPRSCLKCYEARLAAAAHANVPISQPGSRFVRVSEPYTRKMRQARGVHNERVVDLQCGCSTLRTCSLKRWRNNPPVECAPCSGRSRSARYHASKRTNARPTEALSA